MSKYELNYNDYINILDFYNIRIPADKNKLKPMAEKILARKLCLCIKKLEPKYKVSAIPICTRSVIQSKNKTRGKFNCINNTIEVYRRKKKKNITRKRVEKQSQKNRIRKIT
jgi:hypothetical protein